MDTGSRVADDYFEQAPFAFEGKLKRLQFKNLRAERPALSAHRMMIDEIDSGNVGAPPHMRPSRMLARCVRLRSAMSAQLIRRLPTLTALMRSAVLAASLVTSGCAGIGAPRLPVDRFNYSAAIASSTNEQMLLNLVRLRYNETPVFLDVNTVIAQYQLDARAQVGVEVGFSTSAGPAGDNLVNPEMGAAWSERPTITYAPRSGPKFIRRLLTPLPPLAVAGLVQGNWPVEDVVWGVVRSINGVSPRSPVTGRWNPDYQRMLAALAQVQRARALGVGIEGDSRPYATLRFRTTALDDKTAEAINRLVS